MKDLQIGDLVKFADNIIRTDYYAPYRSKKHIGIIIDKDGEESLFKIKWNIPVALSQTHILWFVDKDLKKL